MRVNWAKDMTTNEQNQTYYVLLQRKLNFKIKQCGHDNFHYMVEICKNTKFGKTTNTSTFGM